MFSVENLIWLTSETTDEYGIFRVNAYFCVMFDFRYRWPFEIKCDVMCFVKIVCSGINYLNGGGE